MSEDLTGRLADILNEKVERWLDGEEGVSTFADLLRAALKEAGAVVEPGWTLLIQARFDDDDDVFMVSDESSIEIARWEDDMLVSNRVRRRLTFHPTHFRPLPAAPKPHD